MQSAPGGDGFSVVLMAAPPRRIVPEPSEDARKVAEEIERRPPAARQRRPRRDANTVESMLQASPAKFEAREVYFLTDLQQSTWIAARPTRKLSAILQRIQKPGRR